MIDRFSLAGRTVVVTGAAGILGQRFCSDLLAAKANVVAIDLSEEALSLMRDTLQAGPALSIYCADIREKEQIAEVHIKAVEHYGEINGLLNNAATKSSNFFEPFETFPSEDWNLVMSVNLLGAVVCSQEFGGAMARRGSGSIVNVLSVYGVVAPDQRIYEDSEYLGRSINTPAVYSASKAGLWGLTMYLSSYWGARGVRVNAFTPGGIFSGQNDAFVDRYSARVPMGRMGKPDELSGALVYLLSDASKYVTGQNIVIDGGLTVW